MIGSMFHFDNKSI